MKGIYSDADLVLIWLGPSSSAWDWFVDRMMLLAALAWQHGLGQLSDPTKRTDAEFWRFIAREEDGLVAPVSDQSPSDEPFERFLSEASAVVFGPGGSDRETFFAELGWWLRRPWFTRVWVVQEYVLARLPLFVCGSKRIEPDVFLLASAALAAMSRGLSGAVGTRLRTLVASRNALGSLLVVRTIFRSGRTGSGHGPSLRKLLGDLYRYDRPQMLAIDQRDRVCAQSCTDKQ